MIKAILACDHYGGIGKNGSMPWPNNPKDLKWFKENTTGHVVIMGSTTWNDDHMPSPMPNRINVVVSSNPGQYQNADGHIFGDNITNGIQEVANEYPDKITWVIGGASIIEQSLNIIDEFYISRIPGEYDCDRFLPLKKIQTLFELSHQEVNPEVVFEIWRAKRKLHTTCVLDAYNDERMVTIKDKEAKL